MRSKNLIGNKKPHLTKFQDVNRALQDIYDITNKLTDAVNSSSLPHESFKGARGDIRVNDEGFQYHDGRAWQRIASGTPGNDQAALNLAIDLPSIPPNTIYQASSNGKMSSSLLAYPSADGSANQPVVTSGSGVLSFSSNINLSQITSSTDLTLDSAGILLLDAASGDANQGVQFLLDGTRVGDITGHHANTYFTLYENAGASTSDYFAIKCGANGDSDIITFDATGATAHLNITPDGQLTLNPVSTLTFQPTGTLMIRKSMFQQEQASADADQVAYGQIWVKNATPNELYFTNDAGNDIQITSGSSTAGGGGYWIQSWNARVYTKNLYWHSPHSTYGLAYYNWSINLGVTSLPSTWADSNSPMIVVPKDCTLTEYNFTGNFTSSQTYELALMKGTGVTYGSAGDYSLSQVGATQSQAATSSILYSLGQTGLSVSLSKGDMLIPLIRRSTTDTTSLYFMEMSFSIVCEIG